MILVVNMIPNNRSGETSQDSEPNIAVNPANPLQIVGTAFTPDPMGGSNAPIYVSSDGGKTWLLNSIVPSSAGSGSGTFDITPRFSSTTNTLYVGILRDPSANLQILRTSNFLSPTIMTILVDRADEDQPFVQAATVTAGAGIGKDRVFIGHNDFNAAPRTATIEQALDGAAAPAVPPPPPSGFTSDRLEVRGTSGQDGPQIRPVIHPDGTIYGIFYSWHAFNGTIATADVIVVREDSWGTSPTPFNSLIDPPPPLGDGKRGRRVAQNRSVPWAMPGLGQERVGGDLSIAVDPQNSSTIYIAWADQVGANDYTLHINRSTDRGMTWSPDLRTITNAKNPALAINSLGTVGFLYQQLTGTAPNQRWETHVERTSNAFAAITDLLLATVPDGVPARVFFPYIGDYDHLMAVGSDFYGVFSANNTPDMANFPQGVVYHRNANFATHTLLNMDNVTPVAVSIDPFFFKLEGGHLWHTQRQPDGSWSGLGDVNGQFAIPGPVRAVSAISSQPGETQFMFTTQDGHLWHTQRQPDGSWSGLGDVNGQFAIPGPVRAVSAASSQPGETQFMFATEDGHLWHTQRQPDGSWSGLGDVNGQFAIPGPVRAVSAASSQPGETQFMFATEDGHLWHTQRRPDGSWSGLGDVNGQFAIPGAVHAVSATSSQPGETQFMFATEDGHLWHTQRRPDGSWSGLGDVNGQFAIPGAVHAVSATSSQPGETQFMFTT